MVSAMVSKFLCFISLLLVLGVDPGVGFVSPLVPLSGRLGGGLHRVRLSRDGNFDDLASSQDSFEASLLVNSPQVVGEVSLCDGVKSSC